MKTTRKSWLLLACLATPAAYAIPPQVGGNDANLGAIDGNSFSTTTRLNGEVLFAIRDLLGENDIGEGALFGHSERLRLGFDTSFTGEDSLRTRFSGGAGYTENIQEQVNNTDNSAYYFLGGDIGTTIASGPFNAVLGLGGGFTYYDEDITWRQDDENFVPDVYSSIGATYRLSDSAVVKAYARGYYGSHANVSRNFIKGGVTGSDYFFWDSDLGADYRFDNAALGQQGFELSTNLSWSGLEEDDDGPASNELDNFTFGVRQEGRYNIDENTSVFVEGRYSRREWQYDPMGISMYDLDSNSFRVGGGARMQCGDTFTWSAAAGAEFRDYNDLPPNGDDSRTEFYINGDFSWKLGDALVVGAYADYGIQNFHPNEGPADAYIDPLGLRSGLRAHYQWNETTSFTADSSLTRVQGSEVVSPMYDGLDFYRWACGLSVNHMLNDRVELFLDGELVQLDNDQDDETYFRGGVGARVGF